MFSEIQYNFNGQKVSFILPSAAFNKTLILNFKPSRITLF